MAQKRGLSKGLAALPAGWVELRDGNVFAAADSMSPPRAGREQPAALTSPPSVPPLLPPSTVMAAPPVSPLPFALPSQPPSPERTGSLDRGGEGDVLERIEYERLLEATRSTTAALTSPAPVPPPPPTSTTAATPPPVPPLPPPSTTA